jgi:hypothetical protein
LWLPTPSGCRQRDHSRRASALQGLLARPLTLAGATRHSDPVQSTSTGHQRARVRLAPGTRLGLWAVRLLIAFAALFVTISALVVAGQRGVWLLSLVVPLFLSGLLAAATAAVAVVRRGERSVLVFLPLIVGILIAFFLVGELIGHD